MPTPLTMPITRKRLPKHGNIEVQFRHRDDMKRRGVKGPRPHPGQPHPHAARHDAAGGQHRQPDRQGLHGWQWAAQNLGDCGECMADNVMRIASFGQGKPGWSEIMFDVNAR